ncbi:MAG TPA: phospholipase D-like domain-containing protein, partial [Vicinamibacterales bacterium]
SNYANVGALSRRFPSYPIDPQMNFPPSVSYRDRAVAAYNAESTAIDVNMFRITDRAHTDAIIAAVQRGVKVRLITEQEEYRNTDRLWDSWNVDRMCVAGVAIRQRGHDGLNHEKVVLLRKQAMVIFGSSNWTSPSNQSQEEHNEFTTKPYFWQWFTAQFLRKWNNTGPSPETAPFHPLPPDEPSYVSPANGATNVSATGATLSFDAGPFAHLYDIYLGTSANPGLIAADVALGPTAPGGSPLTYQLPALAPGTTYSWHVVAKTMAEQPAEGPVWSFTTAGSPGPPPQPLPSPAPAADPVNACGPDDSTGPPSATSRPAMWLDMPSDGATVRQPFAVTGWAVDQSATADNGIDAVHVWAFAASGAPPTFIGWTPVNWPRPDVAGLFGARHTASGFGLVASGLQPGSYTLVAYAHSSVAQAFTLAQTRRVQIAPSATLVLDAPSANATLGQGFMIGGWAADFAASTGGGIDVVDVYAYPLDTAGGPVLLGVASVTGARPDVGAFYGAQFATTGFNLLAPPLTPGHYRIVAYGRSLVAGTFDVAALALVNVR